jgi:hypothetical protein
MFELIMFIAAVTIIILLAVLGGTVGNIRRRTDELAHRLAHIQAQLHRGDAPHPPMPEAAQPMQPPMQQQPQPAPMQPAAQALPSQPFPQPLPIPRPQPQQAPPSPTPQFYPHHYPPPQPQAAYRFPSPPQQQTPPWQAASQPMAATDDGRPRSRSVENLLGRNILGIVAAVLVFLGLVFLGFLVVPQLTDGMRVTLMFLLSTALLAGGFLLNRRYSNNFTKTLLGCGCGAFFISIMVTHLYFHLLNEIVAFSLLLVWIAVSLLFTRLSRSLLVGIITHAGMIISVCAGYLAGLDDSHLLLLMAYQLLSTVLICGGNILCCKKMYRFGLFASLTLTVFSSLVMWERFFRLAPGFDSQLPVGLIATAFLVQFLGASFLSYLLLVSCIRLRDTAAQMLLQGIATVLWELILAIDVTVLLIKLYPVPAEADGSFLHAYAPLLPALAVSLALIIGIMLALALLRRRMAFSKTIETTTVVLLAAGAGLLLAAHGNLHAMLGAPGPSISYLVVPAVALMAIQRISNNGTVAILARVFLGLDGFFMLCGGFGQLTLVGGIGLSIAWLVGLLALVYASYRSIAAERRGRYATATRLIILIAFQVSLANITFLSPAHHGSFERAALGLPPSFWEQSLFFLVCSVLLLVMMVRRQDRPLLFFRINEFAIMILAAARISISTFEPVVVILNVLTALVCFAILLERIRRLARATAAAAREPWRARPQTGIEVLGALALTALFFALINGLTDWLDQPYSLSLAAMSIALVIVALGFWSRCGSLRVYGLVLVLLSVVKLVTLDIQGLDTLMRVVSFIGGGLICFGISALYNFAVKRFEPAPSENLRHRGE